MRILVYEHITGGGCTSAPFPLDMAAQGYAMATAALEAFGGMAGCRTCVLHDMRIPASALPADRHVPVGPGRQRERFLETVDEVDGVLVIAPETEGILAALTAEVERRGKQVLGASSLGIQAAADKLQLSSTLSQAGVRVPRTIEVPLAGPLDAVPAALGPPCVIKPRVGAGGEGVSLVRNVHEIAAALERVRHAAGDAQTCLAQEYVAGEAASVSLLTDGRRARPLALNRQFMCVAGRQLAYRGGEVPYDHPQRDLALAQAAAACEAVPGLRGYVGVDVILGAGGPAVIEINPRWTTSCVGLQRVLVGNLGRAVLDAVLRRVLPAEVQLVGRVRFDMEALRQEFMRAVEGRGCAKQRPVRR